MTYVYRDGQWKDWIASDTGQTEQLAPGVEPNLAASQLRGLLERLIPSSSGLDLRVWLDGIYTDIENAEILGDWMKGREVYFKVEGRVDGLEGSRSSSD